MKKVILPSSQHLPSQKDENGFYLKAPVTAKPEPTVKVSDISIESLMQKGLLAIERTIAATLREITAGNPATPSREAIMNLKDCMAMLESLKKREEELLNNLTDEELKKLV